MSIPYWRMSLFQKTKWWWWRGWNEYPEVMAASVLGVGSMITGIILLCNQHPEDLNYRYKYTTEILRPDNPLLLRVRKYDDSPEPTRTPEGFIPTVGLAERVWVK